MPSESGHVYCYEAVGFDNLYKIGWTTRQPEQRMQELATGSPVDLVACL